MGMDVMRYEVARTINKEEVPELTEDIRYGLSEKNYQIIEVDTRTEAWLKEAGFSLDDIRIEKEFDWDTWVESNPQYKEYTWVEYSFDDNEKHWAQLESSNGEIVLLDDGFVFKDVKLMLVEQKQMGYMRKPFRHSDTPTRVEGDTVVLTVTNFSDEGMNGFEELKKIDAQQTEDANVYVFKEDHLRNLKKFSYDPKYFSEAFIEDFKKNQYVLFNW